MLKIYGIEHLLYLLVTIPVFILAIYLIKKKIKTTQKMDMTIKIIGVIYLLVLIWNRISASVIEVGWDHFLPNLYCGMSGIALSLSLIFLKRNHIVLHCIIYISVLGGLLTMIYPDFIVHDASLFYLPTISGLIHHSFLLFIPILLVYTGYVKPELKKYYVLPIGMAVYITFGVFEMTVLGYESAMYLFEPVLAGTMFDWFGFALIFLPTHLIFLIIWQYLPNRFIPKSVYDNE